MNGRIRYGYSLSIAVLALIFGVGFLLGDEEEGGEDHSGYGRDRDYGRDSDGYGRNGHNRRGTDDDPHDRITGSGSGVIVFRAYSKVYRVTATGRREITIPGGGYLRQLRDAGNGRMIVSTSKKQSWLWDVKANRFSKIPGSSFSYYGTTSWIKNRYALGFVPKYRSTWLYSTEKNGRTARRVPTYSRYLASKFDFLPDGRHLFVHAPGMGRKESMYFIDKILNSTQYLYYVPSFPGRPRRLLAKDVFGNPVLADSGRRILYWRLQGVDTAQNRRYLVLQSVSVATKKEHRVMTVMTKARSRAYQRWMPSTIVYRKSGTVLVESGEKGSGQWRLADAGKTGTRRFNQHGGFLINPVGSKIFGRSAVRDQEDPAAVIINRIGGKNVLRVYRVPDGKLLFSGLLPVKSRRIYRSIVRSWQGTYIP